MHRRVLAPLLLACLALQGAAGSGGGESDEILALGQSRDDAIAGGETRAYRVAASRLPLLVTVEQRGIDLVVLARGPSGARLGTDSLNERWGPEILLLPAGGAGEHRIEIRPLRREVAPGHYTIRAEELPASTPGETRRLAAWSAMFRANQLSTGKPENQSQAAPLFQQALREWKALGDRRGEAEALTAAAILAKETNHPRPAIDLFQQVIPRWRKLGETRREAAVLSLLGVTYGSLGEAAPSRRLHESALAAWEGLDERLESLVSRGNLCLADIAEPATARVCEEVRAGLHQLGDKSQEARLLNILGGAYQLQGEPEEALTRYRQAILLYRELGDRSGEVEALNNIAVIHRLLGQWQEALDLYDQARATLAPLGDTLREAKLLNNLASVYADLSDLERARALYGEALERFQEAGAGSEELLARRSLGDVLLGLGELEPALGQYRLALERSKALANSTQGALIRLAIAKLALEQKDRQTALREIAAAQAVLSKAGLHAGELQALWLQGLALAQGDRPLEALPILEKVCEQSRQRQDRAAEARALQALAATERRAGLKTARRHAQEALDRVEELRTSLVSPSLRTAFFASQYNASTLLIELEMDRHEADRAAGHDREALAISERARARGLLEALYAGRTGGAGDDATIDLWKRRESLRYRLADLLEQRLRNRAGTADERTDVALGRTIATLQAELETVEAKVRQQDPDYAAFSRPQPITVPGIAGLLDPDMVLLEYSLGETRSSLFVVDASGLRSFSLPSRREIEDLTRQAYEELRTIEPGAPPSASLRRLSQTLLAPIWSQAAALKRLVVVPDGALHVLPFGALLVPAPGHAWGGPEGEKPLLERLEVTYIPSATTLALARQRNARRPKATRRAAVFADPVFEKDDARLAGRQTAAGKAPNGAGASSPRFPRLPASRAEAEAIASLAPAGEVWKAVDFEASREAVFSPELRSYRTIHFATHGIADIHNPEGSGLVLSLVDAKGQPRLGFVGLSDLFELDLAAELVVLSACRSAFGKEVRGEGVMGLTRGFLYAGVPRVVASLWPVPDNSTAELIQRFYLALWRDGKPASAALREAQLALRQERRTRDPYFWAGFVLQGDWR